jgi:hypothetical protein
MEGSKGLLSSTVAKCAALSYYQVVGAVALSPALEVWPSATHQLQMQAEAGAQLNSSLSCQKRNSLAQKPDTEVQ